MNNKALDILSDIAHRYEVQMRDVPAAIKIGLTPFQLKALTIIGRFPGCSQQTLAEWSGRDRAQIARAIKELEARELITRRVSELNWRMLEMNLTTKGEQIFKAAVNRRAAIRAAMMADVTEEERGLVAGVLEKILRGLDATGKKSG